MEKSSFTHFFYIFHKPESLGTEFNTVTCSVTGYFLFIEINIRKEGMKNRNYHIDIGKLNNVQIRLWNQQRGWARGT